MVSQEKVPIIEVFWVFPTVVSLGLQRRVRLPEAGSRGRWSPGRENGEGASTDADRPAGWSRFDNG